MKNVIYSVRQFTDVSWLAKRLDNDDAKQAGIYIGAQELEYYKKAPWIEAFAFVNDNVLCGFVSANLSERVYGRGIFSEFYIAPEYRNNRLSCYRFYKWCMANMFKDCHRVVAFVRIKNTVVMDILKRLGWKQECAVKRFDSIGETYIQFSISGRDGVNHG